MKVTRILFPNGSIDPWHALGITKDISPDAKAIFINGKFQVSVALSGGHFFVGKTDTKSGRVTMLGKMYNTAILWIVSYTDVGLGRYQRDNVKFFWLSRGVLLSITSL